MLRVAIKGVLARKLRLLLTSVAVVLGVAFVSGAFLLTDSLRSSFDDLFDQATMGLAVEVRTERYQGLSELQTGGQAMVSIDLAEVGIDETVRERIEGIDGVDAAVGSLFEVGSQPLDKDGEPLGSQGSPTFLANWEEEAGEAGILSIVEGEAPGEGEMMLDKASARDAGHELGDTVTLLTQGGRTREEFKLSGLVQFGSSTSSFFGTISVVDTPTAQRLLGTDGNFSAIDILADDTVSDETLKRRVAEALGAGYSVVTGEELGAELSAAVDEGFLSIMQNFILVFAAIAVFVGAFVIFNTFTILVGQRVREFGILRAIGAGRPQLLGIVALEALVVGVLASTLGLFAGYGVASALREAIGAAGVELPSGAFPFETRTIVWCYAVGVLVTLVACLLPAWRASRLSPLDAVRSSYATNRVGWRIPVLGAVLLASGAALVLAGFNADDDASTTSALLLIGVGLGLAVLGIALLSRLIVAPVTRVLAPIFAYGTSGTLATRNTLRNRARSATTASALMIGLAIATLALVFNASLSATINKQIDAAIGSDITVFNSLIQSGQPAVVGDEQIKQIADVDGVGRVAGQRQGSFQVGDEYDTDDVGATQYLAGMDDDALGDDGLLAYTTVEGESEPGDGILVGEDVAREEGVGVGDEIDLVSANGETGSLEVVGLFAANEVTGSWIVSIETFDALQPPAARAAAFLYVDVEDGTSPRAVVDRIEEALGDDGKLLEVQDTEQLRESFEDQFQFIIGVVLAMLFLSLVIALFGIANTLALNVFERTQEIGLIRAVGGTRRQVRRMIRVEAILVALFGAALGVVVGIGAGAALVTALKSEGFVFAVEWLPIVLVLVGGFLAGLLASILPARRAARMDVLRAIATE